MTLEQDTRQRRCDRLVAWLEAELHYTGFSVQALHRAENELIAALATLRSSNVDEERCRAVEEIEGDLDREVGEVEHGD